MSDGDIQIDRADQDVRFHPHMSAPAIRKHLLEVGKNPKDYYFFSVTRNPLSMLWSYHRFFRPDENSRYNYDSDHKPDRVMPFSQWLIDGRVGLGKLWKDMTPEFISEGNLSPLSLEAHICDVNDRIVVNDWFKLEEFGKLQSSLSERLGIDVQPLHVNQAFIKDSPRIPLSTIQKLSKQFPLEFDSYGIPHYPVMGEKMKLVSKPIHVVYVAVGAEYRSEAVCSANSLLYFNREASVTIYTDEPSAISTEYDREIDIRGISSASYDPFVVKVECISDFLSTARLPFLYLDTDTFVTDEISDIERTSADMSLALMPSMDWSQMSVCHWDKLESFNTGVMYLNPTEGTKGLVSRWLASVRGESSKLSQSYGDQNHFNSLLDRDDGISIQPMNTLMYNLRAPMYSDALSLSVRPKIIHGRRCERFARRHGLSPIDGQEYIKSE